MNRSLTCRQSHILWSWWVVGIPIPDARLLVLGFLLIAAIPLSRAPRAPRASAQEAKAEVEAEAEAGPVEFWRKLEGRCIRL